MKNQSKGEKKNDVEYKVYPENGVVICRLLNCQDVPYSRIIKYMQQWPMNDSKYEVDNVFIGMAKCSPEDTFDEQYGKKLALERAKEKRRKAFNNMVRLYINDTMRGLNDLIQYGIHEDTELEGES